MSKRKDRFVIGFADSRWVYSYGKQMMLPITSDNLKEALKEYDAGAIPYKLVPHKPKKRGKKR